MIMELIVDIFIRSWFGSVIRHIGAGLRYGWLRLFRKADSVIQANPLWFGRIQ